MTPAELDHYHEEKCQYYIVMGHIAKIYWWMQKKKKPTQQDGMPQALVELTLDNTITET